MNERERRIARARLLRREGKTYNEIRALLEITAGDDTLQRWLRGIPRPPTTFRSHPKREERRRARQSRMAGCTYPEIAQQLGVAMGSLNLWLRDLPTPDRVRQRRVAHLKRLQGSGGYKLRQRALDRRNVRLERAQQGIEYLSERELFFMGLALYWAEGSKDKPWKRHGRVRLTNSDVGLLRTYLLWLELLGIERGEMSFALSIHESQDAALHEAWWQEQLGLDAAQFRRPMLKRHNPKPHRYNTGDGYHGCLVVTVTCSTALYDAIDGWWSSAVDRLQGKEAGSDRVVLGSNPSRVGQLAVPLGFGPRNRGSSPCPGAALPVSNPWLPARWWDDIAPVRSDDGSGKRESGSP